jgi:undecaprenyl-diphosphatase
LSQHLPDSSFPSDHTVFVFSIAIALIFRSKTIKIASILFIFAVLQGLARIVEGVHYPFDILGAIGVASISVLTIFVFKDQFKSIDKYITKLI